MSDITSAKTASGERVVIRNKGWSDQHKGYLTQISFKSKRYTSVFVCDQHLPMQCPDPASRLAHDEEFMELIGLVACELKFDDGSQPTAFGGQNGSFVK